MIWFEGLEGDIDGSGTEGVVEVCGVIIENLDIYAAIEWFLAPIAIECC